MWTLSSTLTWENGAENRSLECYCCCCCCRWWYFLVGLLVLRPSISSLLQSAAIIIKCDRMCCKTENWHGEIPGVGRPLWRSSGDGSGVKHWSENTAPGCQSTASSQCSCQHTQTVLAKGQEGTLLTSRKSLDTRAQWKAAEKAWSIL